MDFVRWLQQQSAGRAGGLRLGIGDDAALVHAGRGQEIILTSDLSIEGVHFLPQLHPAQAVGHRALARSLSDVAAMGGTPRFALISLAISRRTTQAWLKEFYAGVFALARHFGVRVVGGDTAIVKGATTVDATVMGEVAKGKAITRSGAHPGDEIFVSGCLGLSALGLRLIRARAKRASSPAGRKSSGALRAHFYPEPRCSLGRFLSDGRLATALMDLSDGLSTDLARLCQASRVGARIDAQRIPIPTPALRNGLSNQDALTLALNGGEDYELLFTVSPTKVSQIPGAFRGIPIHHIGEVSRTKPILLKLPEGREIPLQPAGYDHFKKFSRTRTSGHLNSR
jgi:thiamine-monophosphate kinase